jgi:hypothetical protein
MSDTTDTPGAHYYTGDPSAPAPSMSDEEYNAALARLHARWPLRDAEQRSIWREPAMLPVLFLIFMAVLLFAG